MSIRLGFLTPLRAVLLIGAGTSCALQLLVACGQTVEVGIDDALTSGASSGAGGALQVAGNASSGTGGESGQAGAAPCVTTECRGKIYQCGDCDDNDADGAVDAFDSACLGPCDDDETGLSSGMSPSQTAACRQDCYFDGDSGPGNDQCAWSHQCDPLSVAPDYPPSGEMRCEYLGPGTSMGMDCDPLLQQAPGCVESCLPLVPNGCDCFGCCQLPDGKSHFIGRGRGELGCQLDALDDPIACPVCTQVDSCLNSCDECEVCVGKQPEAGCSPDSACPPGQAACTTDAPCDYQEYCVTGCCVRAPEPI